MTEVEGVLCSAVEKVFATMLGAEVKRLDGGVRVSDGGTQVAGSVSLVGHVNGLVSIATSSEFAHQLTGQLLGLNGQDTQSEEMVNDAIGELTNMVGGHLKSQLADRGLACRISIPSIIRGSSFTVESVTDTVQRTVYFRCQGHEFSVEVILKQDS